ncbi:MAG: membrane protein insertase YidC, partial [Elusimicrobia bacterium]|nr:membrane protein insertase YidC [Elusimicrobiota bacterium]
SLTAPSVELAARSSRVWEVPFYIGAKGNTWLSRYNSGLERSIDFGFFAQLGRAVLFVLAKTQRATGNWGWSIILLTVAIQLIMFPLTYQSLKATSAMKRLQPQIARLQQRYAKEPQRLNSEMMELYKKNGANPLGGCLPMLVQMPVFFALYDALRNAWELHGQAWIWWIHDLSAKDPYYVLPLLMGALMFAQNKLNPAMGTDPTQKQIMLFMPIIFTVMFLRFPSGLVLYWMTNSLISTLAQLALYDRFAKQAPAAS